MIFSIRNIVIGLLLALAGQAPPASAKDSPVPMDQLGQRFLYRVAITSHEDVRKLIYTAVDPFASIPGGYLVLADGTQSLRLIQSGLTLNPVADDVTRATLMMTTERSLHAPVPYPVVFDDGGLKLYRVPPDEINRAQSDYRMMHPRTEHLKIRYRPPVEINLPDKSLIGLDSLIGDVSQDSIEAYSHKIETFGHRWWGTTGNIVCGNWIFGKFMDFGYDSVFVHNFESQGITGRNIVAVKPGTVYPEHHIIVCGHYDTGNDADGYAPGADDNGSGTVGVLEIARALSDIDSRFTIVYICFDAEEEFMVGSGVYAEEAAAEDREIMLALNMDMIAHEENDHDAWAYYYDNDAYGQLWAQLALDPEINITGHVSDSLMFSSDEYPFALLGYDAMLVHEYIFSTHYHTSHDSTAYLNYDYLTRMIKATLGTVYVTDSAVTPPPKLVMSAPDSIPNILLPGIENTLRLHIDRLADAQVVPAGVHVHYSIDGGDYIAMPMTDLGNDTYQVGLSGFGCGSNIRFYFTAEEASGETFWYPISQSPFEAFTATDLLVPFEDDFATDKGWQIGGSAVNGHWQRVDDPHWPVRDPYDDIGCYVTSDNAMYDVDNGETNLRSPLITIAPGDIRIRYALWYANDYASAPYEDVFKVNLLHDQTLICVDSVGPSDYLSSQWQVREIRVNDFFIPEYPFYIQFSASDFYNDSHVEAAVDIVSVSIYSYDPKIVTDQFPDAVIDQPYSAPVIAAGCSSELFWTDKNGDLTGTGLSLSADGMLSGTPTNYGQIEFIAMVEDTAGLVDEKPLSVVVNMIFTCGDGNSDETVNVADAVLIINYVFNSGPPPDPLCAGDANGDDDINVSDAVHIINYVFKGGPSPVEDCCP